MATTKIILQKRIILISYDFTSKIFLEYFRLFFHEKLIVLVCILQYKYCAFYPRFEQQTRKFKTKLISRITTFSICQIHNEFGFKSYKIQT